MSLLHRIRDAAGKSLKIDAAYVIRGAFWLTVGQLAAAAAAFGLSVVFANKLSKEDYGTYKYALSVAGLLSAFSLTGLPTAVVQAVSRGFEGTVGKAFWVGLKWCVPSALMAAVASAWYWRHDGNAALAACLLLAGLSSPLSNSAGIYSSYMNGRRDFVNTFRFRMLRELIPFAAILATLLLTRNLVAVVAAWSVTNALVPVGLHVLAVRLWPPNDKVDDRSLNYAFHLSVMSLLANIANRLDSVILFNFVGAADLAVYSLAVAFPDQIIGLLKNANALALPKMAMKDKEEVKKVIFQKIWLLGLLGALATLAYWFFAPFLFRWFFPRYLESLPYTRLFAVNIVLSALLSLPTTFLDAQIETRLKYISMVSFNVLKIGIMIPCALYGGIMGVILGELASRTYAVLLGFWFIKKS